MAELEFKYLNEIDISDSLTDSAHVIIEDGGNIRRAPMSQLITGGGVSSWNDLTDKPFSSEMEMQLTEQTIEFIESGSVGIAQLSGVLLDTDGQTCVVTFDGTQYICETVLDGDAAVCGNINAMMGDWSDGVPFIIVCMNGTCMMAIESAGTHIVSISVEKVTKIPIKYIPVTTTPSPCFTRLSGYSIYKFYDESEFKYNSCSVAVYTLNDNNDIFDEYGSYKYAFGMYSGDIFVKDGSSNEKNVMYRRYYLNSNGTIQCSYWVFIADEEGLANFESLHNITSEATS